MSFSRVLRLVRFARDHSALWLNGCLAVMCAIYGLRLLDIARARFSYAGWPPNTLPGLMAYAADPFLPDRLLAWATSAGALLLGVVLLVGALEGAWAALRRI